jgi:hypothetical protein
LRSFPKSRIKNAKWLLLVLDVDGKTIKVIGFTDRGKASDEIDRIEKSAAFEGSQIDAVLVWVNSINQLKSAYPNYYADTAAFLKALDYSLARNKLQRFDREGRLPHPWRSFIARTIGYR